MSKIVRVQQGDYKVVAGSQTAPGAITFDVGTASIKLAGNTSGGVVSLDSVSGVTTANMFTTNVETANLFDSATTVNIANVGATGRTVNIAAAAISGPSTLTFGGAVTNNTLQINSITTGTVNLTTGVTTGSVNLFPSVVGSINIGGNTISVGNGVVKLGVTPNITATGREVVTAEWVVNRISSVDMVTQEFTTLAGNQVFDVGFNWADFRTARYTVHATQIGSEATRTQSCQLLVTTDVPVFKLYNVLASTSTVTIPVADTSGIYPGMTVTVTAGPGAVPPGTTVVSLVTNTSVTLSNPPSIALNGTTLKGSLSGYYVSDNTSTSSGTTVTVNTTSKLYPGMSVEVTTGTGAFAAGTFVTSITSATEFTVNQQPLTPLNNATITGKPNIYITEYAVLEPNGTAVEFSAVTNSTNVTVVASPQSGTTFKTVNPGTISKTIIKAERQLISLI